MRYVLIIYHLTNYYQYWSNKVKYVSSINRCLDSLLSSRDNILIIGEDIVDPYGGAFGVTKGLSTKYPTKVISTPICEYSIIGMSIGLSLRGFIPIVEVMFGDFITLAIDQIINHASKYCSMYGEKLKLPIIIRTPMGGGRGYGPTHSQSLERMLLGIPNIYIVAPSIYNNPGRLLEYCISIEKPVIFIENKMLYPEEIIDKSTEYLHFSHTDDITDIILIKNYDESYRSDISIVLYGGTTIYLKNLLKKLKEEEIRVDVIIPSIISPISEKVLYMITNCINKTKKCLFIEESSASFSWSSEIISLVKKEGTVLEKIGSVNSVIPSSKFLESKILISENKIYNKILELL